MSHLSMPAFLPGLELSRLFYQEAVRPLLDRHFPDLPHAAALIGPGSEVLGFDTEMSRDHSWGPRVLLFLRDEELHQKQEAILALLGEALPFRFLGYPTGFRRHPDGSYIPDESERRPLNHRVEVLTPRDFFQTNLGIDVRQPLEPADWLSISEEGLLSVTAGAVFYDDIGLDAIRRRFRYYPRDVWLLQLAAAWTRIGQEEHLMGRAGSAGDEIGSAITGARLVRDLMRLGFLLERQYAPYPKWFGTTFHRLACAQELEPLLKRALQAADWEARGAALAEAYRYMARLHNTRQIAAPLPDEPTLFYNRPFLVIWGERFAEATRAQIADPAVRNLAERSHIGGIDLVSDSTDLLSDPRLRPVLRRLYE